MPSPKGLSVKVVLLGGSGLSGGEASEVTVCDIEDSTGILASYAL